MKYGNPIDVGIEHVGSTSVEGLWAKPILDIDIIVQSIEDSQKAITLLESVGYRHIGNLGVAAYSDLKRCLAQKYPNDIDAYIDGKTKLILEILQQYGMNKDEVERIKKINKLEKY